MKPLLFLSVLFAVASCNPCKYVAKHQECFPADTVKEKETTTVHDTVEWLTLDSTAIEALFECDSTNQVLIKELNEHKGKGSKTTIVYRNNRLRISLYTDSIAQLKRIISKEKSTVRYIVNPVNENLKKQTEKLQNRLANRRWLWWYFIVSLCAMAVYFVLRKL